jgi:tetratricopeptide (TPR) repeat protein
LSHKKANDKPAVTSVRAARKAAAGGLNTILSDNATFAHIGWVNLAQKFQELFALLNAPSSGLNASEARRQQKEQVSKAIETLLDMAQQECRRLLVEGDAKAAIEGGLRTLKLKEQYYGVGSLQLVPAYFHLARTNQYIDKFKPAEEFLSLAQWTLLKHQEADVSLRAELHQTFGLLYASDGKLEVALKHLATATYYLSVMNGPDHILTSFGYFDLGNVFAAKANMDCAMAYYEKVKTSWRSHLELIITARAKGESPGVQHPTPQSLGEENVQDAQKMLRGIVGLQSERYGKVHQSTASAELVLGMYLAWLGDLTHAFDSLCLALEIHKRLYGEKHVHTLEVKGTMMHLSMDIPDDTSHALDAVEGTEAAKSPEPPAPPTVQAGDPTEDLHQSTAQSDAKPPTPSQAPVSVPPTPPLEETTAAEKPSEGASGDGTAPVEGEGGAEEKKSPTPTDDAAVPHPPAAKKKALPPAKVKDSGEDTVPSNEESAVPPPENEEVPAQERDPEGEAGPEDEAAPPAPEGAAPVDQPEEPTTQQQEHPAPEGDATVEPSGETTIDQQEPPAPERTPAAGTPAPQEAPQEEAATS